MDHVGELDRVADEEDHQVVPDQVPVPVLGLELHREATWVARSLRGVAAADDGREADHDRRLLARLRQNLGPRVLRRRLVADTAVGLELAVRHETAGMDDALRDALTVEVADLLDEVVVLQGRWAPVADGTLVLVVIDGVPLARRQGPFALAGRPCTFAVAARGPAALVVQGLVPVLARGEGPNPGPMRSQPGTANAAAARERR